MGIVGRVFADRSRPALVVVNGSFPTPDLMHKLADRFAGASVLVANLPGMAGVYWAKASVADLTLCLDRAIERLLRNAPIVAMGVSTGNLVSLGLGSPNICRRVAVEPFFETENLWPFIANSRHRMELNSAPEAAPILDYLRHYFWEVFGIGAQALENRDYRYLLDGLSVPTDVLVGQLPLLPQRTLNTWPSFTSEQDRQRLAANPLVTFHEGPPGTGHGFGSVPPGDEKLEQVVHAALRHASRLCA